MDNQTAENTNRELWRGDANDPTDPDNFYAPSVYVTRQGRIGISAGGRVVERTPEEWVELGWPPNDEQSVIDELLEKYPHGFSVAPGGRLSKTILATSHTSTLFQIFPLPPLNGGYLVVEMTADHVGKKG